MSEGWGGDAPKLHWIVDGRAACGMTAPWFQPTLDEVYSPDHLKRHAEQYCRFCLKRRSKSAVNELLDQVFPAGVP